MKTIISFFALVLTASLSFAQSATCIVLIDSLKGSYEGDCRNGKAEGIGKAFGADSYEGSFKNGLPDGSGTYRWKNGDWFTGYWKKGLMDGKGEFFTKSTNSSKLGFWKKNNYKGEYEKPFEILNPSNRVSHQDITNLDKKRNSVTVNMISGSLGQANVDDFQVLYGTYDRFDKRESMNKTKVIEFQNVKFPFRVKFNLGGSEFEVQFFESGEWLANLIL